MFKSKFVDFLARVFISAIFVNAIPTKLLNFEGTINFIMQKGINENIAIILLVSAIICLIFGSLFFIFGKYQRLGAQNKKQKC